MTYNFFNNDVNLIEGVFYMQHNVRVCAIVLIPPNWEYKNNFLYFFFTTNLTLLTLIININSDF